MGSDNYKGILKLISPPDTVHFTDPKWTCYSDYCFDDPNKPNDVFSFTLIPYIHNFDLLGSHIKTIASVDIKKTRQIKEEFITFLKEYPIINFSFIVNDRKKLLGKDHTEAKLFLKKTFELMEQQYILWSKNQPDQKSYYNNVIKKLKCVIRLIENDKKIKQIVNMVLVSFYGAYVSSRIIKGRSIEVFGWFSDRDALNEVCDNLSISLFQYYLNGLTNGQEFKFVAAPAGSTDNAYYEELVRIPDYIAGAIADYDMKNNLVTKDKSNTMLTNYMADNIHNNFIYRLFADNGTLACARVTLYHKDIS